MSNNDWYQVDNVAKVFLATANKRDTRTLRVSATLTEEINPEILQEALHKTVAARPIFQVRIRRGVFWHYMEETDIEPKVVEESNRPCPSLYSPGRKGKLHYQISYYRKRINLDLFHALSDGTGALEFLNTLVTNYLNIKYHGKFDNVKKGAGASVDEALEDSFKKHYTKQGKPVPPGVKAYHPSSIKLPYNQLQFFELQMPVADILPKAKACGVSLTSYIGARLMMSIHNDMPALKKTEPICVSMPVNLRSYYGSNTSRNFFNNVTASHRFTEDITLEDLAIDFNTQLKDSLSEDKIKAQMDDYERMEATTAVKAVPLFIKQPVVRAGVKKNEKTVSCVLSNLGVQKPDEMLAPYIENYSVYCSSNNIFVCVSTYGDTLTLGISSPFTSTSVLKDFVRGLSDDGIAVTAYATEVIK